MGFLLTIARHLDALIGPGLMLLYPLYASIRAIESPSTLDDQQWLTYWALYSLITIFELSCWRVLQWFPFWPYMKLVFCLWLVLPIFNGAAYIYENFVRKYVKIGNSVSSSYTEEQRRVLQMMNPDTRTSVERFIEKHGPEAFARVVRAVSRTSKRLMPFDLRASETSFYFAAVLVFFSHFVLLLFPTAHDVHGKLSDFLLNFECFRLKRKSRYSKQDGGKGCLFHSDYLGST